MGFVAAKCTECGADIEVDDTKDAGGYVVLWDCFCHRKSNS